MKPLDPAVDLPAQHEPDEDGWGDTYVALTNVGELRLADFVTWDEEETLSLPEWLAMQEATASSPSAPPGHAGVRGGDDGVASALPGPPPPDAESPHFDTIRKAS